MLPLSALRPHDIAQMAMPGDLLLGLTPAEPTRAGAARVPLRWFNAALAQVPITSRLWAAARTDWTTVACLTVVNDSALVVTYTNIDGVMQFGATPVEEYIVEQRITRFAIRPLHCTQTRIERSDRIGNTLINLSAQDPVDAARAERAKTDDVALVLEIYRWLTGVDLTCELDAPGHSVAELFATGGVVDRRLFATLETTRPCYLDAEMCGRA